MGQGFRGISCFLFWGATTSFALGLDAKLDAQWSRFERARDYATQKVGADRGTITRDEWESLLAAPPAQALSESDLARLRARQRRAIRWSRLEARALSRLDLDEVRRAGRVAEFCAAFPKGGMLHLHTSGTIDRASAERILDRVNPSIPLAKWKKNYLSGGSASTLYPGELDFLEPYGDGAAYAKLAPGARDRLRELFVLPPGPHDFTRFESVFGIITDLIYQRAEDPTSPDFYDPTADVFLDFVRRARAMQVSYLELTQSGFDAPDALGEIANLGTMARELGVEVRWLNAFARVRKPTDNRERMDKLLAAPSSEWMLGINLHSNETHAPMLEQGQTVYAAHLQARREGKKFLHATVHAGEHGDPRNVRDSLILGAERIGHGVRLALDPVTLEYARQRRVPVEMNLVSNWRLEAVPELGRHPFLDFLRLGLRVSLSTDDEGIFDTDINRDCEAAVSRSDVSFEEMRRMALNSIETAFVDASTRERLVADLKTRLRLFERDWRH